MDSNIYIRNFLWRTMERVAANGISFIVTIILARLLEPSVFGLISLVTVFISFIELLLDSGFGNALIQKKDADNVDFSTVFYFSFSFSIFLYLIVFLCAPFIDSFYGSVGLTSVIRVLGITVIIASIKNIQHAYVAKHMQFKKFFYSTIIGTSISATLGVWLAYNGYGIWALVAQYLSNHFIDVVILCFTVKWRPIKVFSVERLKGLYSFGWKLLASNLIYKLYSDARQLLIGKIYTSADLAFYNRGYRYPDFVNTQINQSLNSILLPAMSNVQNDKERVRSMLRRTIMISQYIMGPCMIGMAVCAKNFVSVVLTDKWLPCVPYLQIFSLMFALGQVGNANMNSTVSLGRSDLRLQIEYLKTGVNFILLIITAFISPFAMAIGFVVSSYIALIICAFPSKKILNYSLSQQLKEILPNFINCLIMGACVYAVEFIQLSNLVTLIIQIIVGIISYILLSIATKSESYYYLKNIIISNLKKNKK